METLEKMQAPLRFPFHPSQNGHYQEQWTARACEDVGVGVCVTVTEVSMEAPQHTENRTII